MDPTGLLVLASEPPATGQPPAGMAADGDKAPGGGGMMDMLIIFGLIFLIFWLLVIRPQSKERKKREALLKQVKKHDRVVTTAGIHGTVVSVTEGEVVLKVDENVRLKFDRSAIWQVKQPAGGEAEEDADDVKESSKS